MSDMKPDAEPKDGAGKPAAGGGAASERALASVDQQL